MGECSFVTEYIAGEKVENDKESREFLGQVAEIFAEAGLGVWQINPRNPHAHTNLIRNAGTVATDSRVQLHWKHSPNRCLTKRYQSLIGHDIGPLLGLI